MRLLHNFRRTALTKVKDSNCTSQRAPALWIYNFYFLFRSRLSESFTKIGVLRNSGNSVVNIHTWVQFNLQALNLSFLGNLFFQSSFFIRTSLIDCFYLFMLSAFISPVYTDLFRFNIQTFNVEIQAFQILKFKEV